MMYKDRLGTPVVRRYVAATLLRTHTWLPLQYLFSRSMPKGVINS
jgi:hypothetical protein